MPFRQDRVAEVISDGGGRVPDCGREDFREQDRYHDVGCDDAGGQEDLSQDRVAHATLPLWQDRCAALLRQGPRHELFGSAPVGVPQARSDSQSPR